jgi:hypothetical protein
VIKIDKHISELLYEHDCVIVPDLGGFLASYSPTMIHPVQHTFSPPSKKIAFNVLLKQNDGLLASHIAQTESFTYNQAIKEIEGYVDHCQFQLSAGSKFIIEKVGTLYKDIEGNLQFDPFKNVNYLKDSFGLVTIQFLPIEQIRNDKEARKSVREVFALRPSEPLTKRSRKKIVNTVLITAGVIWFCFNVYVITPAKFSFSSFSPVPESSEVEKPVVLTPEESITISAPTVVPSSEVLKEDEIIVPETVPVITPEKISQDHYFVIGGAFRSENNASKFSETLIAEGFNNAKIVNPDANLKMVCFNSFQTFDEAQSELNRIKSMQKDAWIYRR